MAAKQERYKKLPPLKGKKAPNTRSTKVPKLTREEIAEGNLASEKIAHRPTKDFSREELGALMQTAPGGAEPHQIKTQSRQFNRVADDMPEATVSDRTIGVAGDSKKRPMSAKTPKIDLND